jgi:hypothetical protein
MLMNRTSKLAAAVALNILADAFSDCAPARMQPDPVALAGNTPLGFVEYSRSDLLNKIGDFSMGGKVRELITPIERALPYNEDMHLKVLKQLLHDIEDNARRDTWAAVSICTGMMCFPGQTRECVKVVYVLNDGTTRSATWIK